jgi:hypothetical protein
MQVAEDVGAAICAGLLRRQIVVTTMRGLASLHCSSSSISWHSVRCRSATASISGCVQCAAGLTWTAHVQSNFILQYNGRLVWSESQLSLESEPTKPSGFCSASSSKPVERVDEKGAWDLTKGGSVVLEHSDKTCFRLEGGGQSLRLKALSEEDRTRWVELIREKVGIMFTMSSQSVNLKCWTDFIVHSDHG